MIYVPAISELNLVGASINQRGYVIERLHP